MPKKILLLNLLILLLSTIPVCAIQCPPVEVPESISGTDIDSFTTTRYAPWIVNYNMTKLDQIENGYHGGEAGQKIFAMAISNDGKKVLVGTDTSGIWKSDDSGKTWKSSNIGIDVIGVLDLEFTNDNNTIYAACSPAASGANLNSTNKSGLYKSLDGGTSWKQINTLFFERMLSTKRMKYYDGYIYVASTYDGIYKVNVATDQIEYLGMDGYTINSIDVCNGYIIASTLEYGNMVSTDSGMTWKAFNQGLNSNNVYATCLNPVDNSTFYCITENELYKSNDGMNSWILLLDTTKIEYAPQNSFRRLLFGPKGDNNQAKLYLGLSNCVYSVRYSDDYGNSFIKPDIQTEHAFMVDNHGYPEEPFVIAPDNSQLMFASFDGEIYKSTDGGTTFYPSSSGYSGMRAFSFLFNKDNPNDIWFAMIDRGAIHTVDTNNNEKYPAVNYWPMEDRYNIRYKTGKTVKFVARDPKNADRIIISIGSWGTDTALKQSYDNGLNWTLISGTEDHSVDSLTFHPQKHNIIYAGERKSIDDGKTWITLERSVLAVSPVDGDVVYSHDGQNIYRSDDAGNTWYKYCSDLLPGLQRITCDLQDVNKIYVGTFSLGMYICYSNENYARINDKNGLVPNIAGNIPIFSIAQDPDNYLHLVAGGADNKSFAPSAGLFESYDGGLSWNRIEGIPGTRDIWVVQFHPTRKQVFVGTSAGVFVYEFDKYKKGNIQNSSLEADEIHNIKVLNNAITNVDGENNYWGALAGNFEDTSFSKSIIAKFDITDIAYENLVEAYISFGASCDTAGAKYQIREIGSDWSTETIASLKASDFSTSAIATFESKVDKNTYKIDLTEYVSQLRQNNKNALNIAITGTDNKTLYIRKTDEEDLLYPRLYIKSTDLVAPKIKVDVPAYVQASKDYDIVVSAVDENSQTLNVNFYIDDVKCKFPITKTGSEYRITVDGGLSEGSHTLKIVATDTNGMSSRYYANITAVSVIDETEIKEIKFINKEYIVNGGEWERFHWNIYGNGTTDKGYVYLLYADLSDYVNKQVTNAIYDISLCSLESKSIIFGVHEITDNKNWHTVSDNKVTELIKFDKNAVLTFENTSDKWQRISINFTDYINSLLERGISELNVVFTVDNGSKVNTYISQNDHATDVARKAPKFYITSMLYGERPSISPITNERYFVNNEAFNFDVQIIGDSISDVKAYIDNSEITCTFNDSNIYRSNVPALSGGKHTLKIVATNLYSMKRIAEYDIYSCNYFVSEQRFTDASGNEFVFTKNNTIKNDIKLVSLKDGGSCVSIVALYNSKNQLIKVNYKSFDSLSKGENDISNTLKLPELDNYNGCYIKGLVWENFTNLKPISSVYMIENVQ